ncbi:2-oxo acid dehydrogenase, lipoyl-binding site-containing protein [Artemisia annua]|uniref:Glycine cleavage system H protein n=1 Tax=Artemisia annua TaxID=35608 RepID=A0A2U1MND8_ARTAN|nr:2-oxo acid dehydrogenase, lipoyl-binding site-containing protein [Artemisia annua]
MAMVSRLWASKAASYLNISAFNRSFASSGLRGMYEPVLPTKPGDLPNNIRCNFRVRTCRVQSDIELIYYLVLSVLKDLKYADSHEWAKIEGNSATIGITDHAQDHLGDVVYVELPEVGTAVTQGSGFGAVESVKATSDINSPVSGKVVEVNQELSTSPGLVNGSPYHNGWIMKVEMSNTEEFSLEYQLGSVGFSFYFLRMCWVLEYILQTSHLVFGGISYVSLTNFGTIASFVER